MNTLVFQTVLLLVMAFIGGCAIGCWLKRIFAAQEVGVSVPVPPELLEDEMSSQDEFGEALPAVEKPVSAEASPPPVETEPATSGDSVPETAPEEAAAADEKPEPAEETPAAEPEPAVPDAPEPQEAASSTDDGEVIEVATEGELSGRQPRGLKVPRGGKADDLKKIKGIGKVNEGRLNGFGIWHFDQIAGWTDEEVEWVNNFLTFPGRIEREDWIGQAKVFASMKEY